MSCVGKSRGIVIFTLTIMITLSLSNKIFEKQILKGKKKFDQFVDKNLNVDKFNKRQRDSDEERDSNRNIIDEIQSFVD